jgi:hypothetical protein
MKKINIFPIFLMFLGISCCSGDNRNSKRNTELIIASPSIAPIIGLDSSVLGLPYIQEFAEYYFSSRCGVNPNFSDMLAALGKSGPKIILCTKETAMHNGIKLPDEEIRHDGFHLISTSSKHGTVIYCVGNNVNGIKYAIYKLIHELSYNKRTLSLTHTIKLSVTPFFENRIVLPSLSWTLGDPEANKKYFFNQWNEQKFNAMIDLFDYFGFNSTEINFGSTPGHVTDNATQNIQLKLLDEQHRIGGKALAFIWGAAYIENGVVKSVGLDTEADRKKMLQIYRNETKAIGGHIDAFISHWADPGGNENCTSTIKIPQLYHVELMKLMKEYNPKIESFFSLWNFHPSVTSIQQGQQWWSYMWHWKSTRVIEDVLDAGILPENVGILVGDPNGFNPDYCRAIINKGRTLGIWTWYLADNEIRQGLHVHWKQLSKYFRDQSAEDYGKYIKWHQLELNRQGDWNDINIAVGGEMMINPQGDAEEYAREFCSSVVGNGNADLLLEVLDAIAQTRCLWHRNLGGLEFHNHAGWGSIDPKVDISRIQKALSLLNKVTLEKDFIPKIPYMELIYNPEVMLSDLRRNLQNILLHNNARSKLLEEIDNKEYKELSWPDKQTKVKELSRELAPAFDLKGIGTCPEAKVWNRLKSTGLLPELPHSLK